MTFKEGLYQARSHIVFILALIATFSLVIGLETWDPDFGLAEVKHSKNIPAPEPEPLSPKEQAWAKNAWTYFEVNLQPKTGLVDGLHGRPMASVEDMGDYLSALIAAQKLDIISDAMFDQRMEKALETIAVLPLVSQVLPNRYYHTQTLDMVDAQGVSVPQGVGWSSVGISRLILPLQNMVWSQPKYVEKIRQILKSWQAKRLVSDGVLYQAYRDKDQVLQYQSEGRIGFQEYAARVLGLMGLEPYLSRQYRFYLQWENVLGIKVPIDLRGVYGLSDYTTGTSDPYVFHGLTFGWDMISRELAYRVYRVQEQRHWQTSQKTAVGMSYTDRASDQVVYAVFAHDRAWVCVTSDQKISDANRTVDLAMAFGWWALYRTPYAQTLVNQMANLNDPQFGWYAGQYEDDKSTNKALTCRTNAWVLQALCYKANGPLFAF